MEITAIIFAVLYLAVGGAAWVWIGWRRRRRGPVRGKARQRPQEFPLLTGFLLLLTWPLSVWEEIRGSK
jgi:hypothetical protein